MHKPEPVRKESISVDFLVDRLRERPGVIVTALNASDDRVMPGKRRVTETNLHRPGLALAGYTDLFTFQRVQILGNTESQYLSHLDEVERAAAFANLVQFEVPCIFLTAGNGLDRALIELASEGGIPVYTTPVPSMAFILHLREILEDQFAPEQTMHATLVDVYGVGLLLVGKSGIGKSELALDLIDRGHRLVADDVVVITRRGDGAVYGVGTELTQHMIEVRGLGVVDVLTMFGIRSICLRKKVEVIVEMEPWDEEGDYTRVGMVNQFESIMGVELPLVKLPIVPGKNATVITEVVAMNYLLREYGIDPARILAQRLTTTIREKEAQARRESNIEYLERGTL